MSGTAGKPDTVAEIVRRAHSLWEEEGRPEGRDREHWFRAEQSVLAESEGDSATGETTADPTEGGARPAQPGFADTPPGIVPQPKESAGAELREEPGGRFAKQIAEPPGKADTAGRAAPRPTGATKR